MIYVERSHVSINIHHLLFVRVRLEAVAKNKRVFPFGRRSRVSPTMVYSPPTNDHSSQRTSPAAFAAARSRVRFRAGLCLCACLETLDSTALGFGQCRLLGSCRRQRGCTRREHRPIVRNSSPNTKFFFLRRTFFRPTFFLFLTKSNGRTIFVDRTNPLEGRPRTSFQIYRNQSDVPWDTSGKVNIFFL